MTANQHLPRQPRPVGERAFLEDLRRNFRTPSSPALILGIGDDCALLRPKPGLLIAITTDLLLEGRHFRRDTHTARSAGHRCLARGLSDLAAMGATPLACFLSLALPPGTLATPASRRWLDQFLTGLHALALAAHVPLAGGDTGEAPGNALLADITLLGQVAPAQALTRAGARPGDDLWVSGSLGGAAAELETLLTRATLKPGFPPRHARPGPQTFPQPRLALGQALARRNQARPEHAASRSTAGRNAANHSPAGSNVARRNAAPQSPAITACIDLSDGLSTDLLHLCTESNVAAQVDARLLPLHPLTRRLPAAQALHLALNGGEDYELLFTTRPKTSLPRTLTGVPLTRIGTILPLRQNQPPIILLDPQGNPAPLAPGGYQHLTP